MNITELSDIELKALAFEQIAQRDQSTQNLELIVSELSKRNKQSNNVPKEMELKEES